MKNIILGVGEVGKALYSLYKEKQIKVIKKDLNDKKNINNVSILNICIPYTNDFLKIVVNEINKLNPKLTIIHSTVPIGTSKKIQKETKAHIVHSPVVGSHPFLKKSLKTFVKYIGTDDLTAYLIAKEHFKKLGIKHQFVESFNATEAAKLLCTSYYGLCIAWHDYINQICKANNINFSFIKEWNENYNKGYVKNNGKKYNRPVLDPPLDHKIGGHCVIPNAELLYKHFPNPLLQQILTFK